MGKTGHWEKSRSMIFSLLRGTATNQSPRGVFNAEICPELLDRHLFQLEELAGNLFLMPP